MKIEYIDIKEIKPYLENHYKTYNGNADLYVYFFEKGLKILKDEGIFAFICSNKFVNVKYGEKLRGFILKNQMTIFDDFSGVKIFNPQYPRKSYPKRNEVFNNKIRKIHFFIYYLSKI